MKRNQWFSLLVMAFGSFALGASCEPEPEPEPDDPTIQPLPQESVVLVEVEVGENWVTIPVPQGGIEKLARLWCHDERRLTDMTLCLDGPDDDGVTDWADGESAGASEEECKRTLCSARNQVCSGYMLEELGRSPLPRTLIASEVLQRQVSIVSDLLVDASRCDSALAKANIANDNGGCADLSVARLRFKPQQAPGRAAALRGALNRYREAGIITRAMTQLTPAQVENGESKCVDILATGNAGEPIATGLGSEPGTQPPSWIDVYYETFNDAAAQYSGALPQTVTAMQESAELQVKGGATALAEIATQWNGEVDSALAVTKLLTTSSESGVGIPAVLKPGTTCGDDHKASDVGPLGVPICPPISMNEGAFKAYQLAAQLFAKPDIADPVGTFERAWNSQKLKSGEISTAYTTQEILQANNLTELDVKQATEYQCANTKRSATFNLAKPPSGTIEPEYYGTAQKKTGLSGGALFAHFAGAVTDSTAKFGTPSYARSGAIHTLDMFKSTATELSTASFGTQVDPVLMDAVGTTKEGLKVDSGGRRLEFVVGAEVTTTDGLAVDNVAVIVHGIPPVAAAPSEQYWVVQGLKGLKCATAGDIDEAPCNPDHYLMSLNDGGTFTATPDPRMGDLEGGYLRKTFQLAKQPTADGQGSVEVPISQEHALYVLRLEAGERRAFGGVVPTTGIIPLNSDPDFRWATQYPWARRAVIMPAGGTYEQVTQSVMAANADDCSKTLNTCVGLPADIFPPLESEIVGTPSSQQPFEQSYKHYLMLAKEAALESDRLGEELIEHGLRMDLRREEALAQLQDLCGVDASTCGVDSEGNVTEPSPLEYVTLGDKPVCLWENSEGKLCDRTGVPASAPCVVPLQPQDLPTQAQCQQRVNQALAPVNDRTAVPVEHALGLVVNENLSPSASAGDCAAFSDLRFNRNPAKLGQPTDDATDRAWKRTEFIRKELMARWGRPTVEDIASQVKYTELFADHYRLTYGESPVFDTRRAQGRKVVALASESIAPCNPGAGDVTGSELWSDPISCYVPHGCANAEPDKGVDGCPNLWGAGSSTTLLSYDTEPDALASRWAWGFGRLRRSVATLGVLTGKLNNMMELARVMRPALLIPGVGGPVLTTFKQQGVPCKPRGTAESPDWVHFCTPNGYKEHKDRAQCVHIKGGAANNRQYWGRPVNFNGFFPNAMPSGSAPSFTNGANAGILVNPFPKLCRFGACEFGGVDPQFIYCHQVDPSLLSANDPASLFAAWENTTSYGSILGANSSGFIGSSLTLPAEVRAPAGEWATAITAMWDDPGGNFCAPKYAPEEPLKGVVWRAFCQPLQSEDTDALGGVNSEPTYDPSYMRFGRVPNPGAELVSGSAVGTWLGPASGKFGHWADALFDLREGTFQSQKLPFQYPLTQRNIQDAVELACHARRAAPVSALPKCDEVTPEDMENASSAEQIAQILECFASRSRRTIQNFVVGGIPKVLIDSFIRDEPLASTSGLGGQNLQEMSRQHSALKRIAGAYAAIGDSQRQVALHVRSLNTLQTKKQALTEAAVAFALSAVLSSYAQAIGGLSEIKPGVISGTSAVAAAAHLAAAQAQVAGLEARNRADNADIELQRTGIIGAMVQEVSKARMAADDLVLALNELTTASANLQLIRKKAQQAVSKIQFSDFAGDDKKDPQYVNVAMRRIYNTKLIRYERAVERAKKLAFLARRAIELRYGVDMQQMAADMTLVEAPNKWVNEICTMEGIDYSEIRSPNPDIPVTGGKNDPFGSPTPGDDFAHHYVGDYVKKLEDFINSYPIDFPLKDSDDTAVISMADDIFQVAASCSNPGPNLLYWSTELDKRDGIDVDTETNGWFVTGCDQPGLLSGSWNGCIELESEPSGIAATSSVLPPGAVAYQVRNVDCSAAPNEIGEATVCPELTSYHAVGAIAQRLRGTTGGYHQVSFYALADGSAVFDPGNAPVVRVVRESDEQVVAEKVLTGLSTTTWQRMPIVFSASSSETYRLEVLPSSLPTQVLNASGGPAVYISALQVERASQDTNGDFFPPSQFVRTGVDRNVIDVSCAEGRGREFRKQFERRCEYVCSDGIKKQCSSMDSGSRPEVCFYEATFAISLEQIESGQLIPSGQIAIGNFNFRHNLAGVNAVGTGTTDCEGKPSSCYANGFLEYTLTHSGNTRIRNYEGATLPAKMDRAFIEHGKMLAAERFLTNPLGSADQSLMESYMKGELKGRPLQGLYTLRVWDQPGLRWERIDDLQLAWKYHYWTRFQK